MARRLAESLVGGSCAGRAGRESLSGALLSRRAFGSALPAQMFFLFARARQIEDMRQADLFSSVRISDYLFTRDRLFAELNLDAEELKLYDQIAANLACRCAGSRPCHLPASRQSTRSCSDWRAAMLPYDRYVDAVIWRQLTDAYSRFFHNYDDGPLLIVNASQIDPINNDADYQQLFQQIERTTGGRHFLQLQ